jgi:hypothetical protein
VEKKEEITTFSCLRSIVEIQKVMKIEHHHNKRFAVQKGNILNIWDLRQLSLRLDNLRLKARQNAGPKAQPAK